MTVVVKETIASQQKNKFPEQVSRGDARGDRKKHDFRVSDLIY